MFKLRRAKGIRRKGIKLQKKYSFSEEKDLETLFSGLFLLKNFNKINYCNFGHNLQKRQVSFLQS